MSSQLVVALVPRPERGCVGTGTTRRAYRVSPYRSNGHDEEGVPREPVQVHQERLDAGSLDGVLDVRRRERVRCRVGPAKGPELRVLVERRHPRGELLHPRGLVGVEGRGDGGGAWGEAHRTRELRRMSVQIRQIWRAVELPEPLEGRMVAERPHVPEGRRRERMRFRVLRQPAEREQHRGQHVRGLVDLDTDAAHAAPDERTHYEVDGVRGVRSTDDSDGTRGAHRRARFVGRGSGGGPSRQSRLRPVDGSPSPCRGARSRARGTGFAEGRPGRCPRTADGSVDPFETARALPRPPQTGFPSDEGHRPPDARGPHAWAVRVARRPPMARAGSPRLSGHPTSPSAAAIRAGSAARSRPRCPRVPG